MGSDMEVAKSRRRLGPSLWLLGLDGVGTEFFGYRI